jgi:serine/threonine protein kinase
VVMYQMLTGILPLRGDTPLDMLFAQIQTPPTPIQEARPGLRISAQVGAVVMKCLEKDPARRPQSGRELIEELELCEKAQPASPLGQSPKDFSESTTIADTPARFPRATQFPSATTFGTEPPSPTFAGTEPNHVPAVPAVPVLPAASGDSPLASTTPANPPLPNNQSSASRATILIRIVIFFLLAGGGWYYFHLSSTNGRQGAPPPNGGSAATGPQPSATQLAHSSPAPENAKPLQPSDTQSGAAQTSTTGSQPKNAPSEAPPPMTAEEKAARAKRVSATTSLGDLYFENGEFDNAIQEYQLGLDADPSNKSLRDKLDRARKAKEAAPTSKP